MAKTLTSRKEIQKALINWINETENDVLELLYNQNFDEPIAYCEDDMFEISNAEALRIGAETLENAGEPIKKNYFEIMAQGWNKDLLREEIQVHCGENGNLMIVKTDIGFTVDVYNQEDFIDSLPIYDDDLETPETEIKNADGDVMSVDENGDCLYCGQKCWENGGQMCDEQQAGGLDK